MLNNMMKQNIVVTASAVTIALMAVTGLSCTSAYAAGDTVDPDIKTCLSGPQPFRDVNAMSPHSSDTKWMYCAGISTGFEDYDNDTYETYYTYRGMSPVIRQDMAAFLRRVAVRQGVSDAAGWSPSTADWDRFRDVDTNTPHAEDVLWLAHAGISTGWKEADGTSTFRPTETVKRQDMAAFLYRLAKLGGVNVDNGKTSDFTDVNDSTPHGKEIKWLGGSGISTGWKNPNGSSRYQGMSNTVRQDMSAFLHRTAGLIETTGYPTQLPSSYKGTPIKLTVREFEWTDNGKVPVNPFTYTLKNAWVNYKDGSGDTAVPKLHLVFNIKNVSQKTMTPYPLYVTAFQHSIEADTESVSAYERMKPNGEVTHEVIMTVNDLNEPIELEIENDTDSYRMEGTLVITMDTRSLIRNSKLLKVDDESR